MSPETPHYPQIRNRVIAVAAFAALMNTAPDEAHADQPDPTTVAAYEYAEDIGAPALSLAADETDAPKVIHPGSAAEATPSSDTGKATSSRDRDTPASTVNTTPIVIHPGRTADTAPAAERPTEPLPATRAERPAPAVVIPGSGQAPVLPPVETTQLPPATPPQTSPTGPTPQQQQSSAPPAPEPEPVPQEAPPALPAPEAAPAYAHPCPTCVVNQEFSPSHGGIDMDEAMGAPLYAVADAVVEEAGPRDPDGFGQVVYLRLADGTIVKYGHISAWHVNKGDVVKAGQLIADVGNAGNVKPGPNGDGTHLHLEVHINPVGVNGTKVNPIQWLRDHGVQI